MTSPLAADELRVVPLGGLGEIGMNCLALEEADGILAIDCGVSFPLGDYGLDVIRPDFTFLLRERSRFFGLFLTHGHEDHIGAIPYLLKELKTPIWGPPHALALVRRRMLEHGLNPDDYQLNLAAPRQRVEIGPFVVEPIRVTHSITQATALAVDTCAGRVIHSGDFNLDPDPVDGEPTDQQRLAELGNLGVRLLLSDSTNIDAKERGGNERSVAETLLGMCRGAHHRVFVALFASNLQRLNQLGQIAQELGRRVCLLGRSLRMQVEVGHETGRLQWPSSLRIDPAELAEFPRDRVMVLVGGTQAEPASALFRLGQGTHRFGKVEPGDRVIFSSRVIPGNERMVHDLICALLRLGADVCDVRTNPEVHASGHATPSEQGDLIRTLMPRGFVPVHGTLRHLLQHASLARELGVDEVEVIESGEVLRCRPAGLSRDGREPVGRIPIDWGGEVVGSDTLRERIELGRRGIVVAQLILGAEGKLVVEPSLVCQGVPLGGHELPRARILKDVSRAVERAHRLKLPVETLVKGALKRILVEGSGVRPVLEVRIVRMASDV